uniref:Uncharacterized protein n=1 Tax=Anguilla anguilla TaxID=7936 RepID=A0A0E9X023_ANGAN
MWRTTSTTTAGRLALLCSQFLTESLYGNTMSITCIWMEGGTTSSNPLQRRRWSLGHNGCVPFLVIHMEMSKLYVHASCQKNMLHIKG